MVVFQLHGARDGLLSLARLAACGLWHSWRAAVVAGGREELRKERVAVVVQLLHLSRQLGVLLGVVQLHLLHDEVVPGFEQLVGEMQFLLVLRRD